MSHSSRLLRALRGVALVSVTWILLATPALAQAPAPANLPAGSTQATSGVDDEGARERASQHFDRGVALFRDGAFEGALVEFRRAYEAVPTSGLLFNLGQTAVRLNDYAQAKMLFERYLQSSGDTLSAERREQVAAELKQLRGRIGYAQISASVSGAEIWVDQRSVGRTPLSEPLTLSVGRHRVEVRADGYHAEVQTLELAGGEERTLEFRLQPLSAQGSDSPAQAAPSPETAKRTWLRPARIASLSLLGVAAVGAVVAGVLASRAHDELGAELASRPGDRSAIDDARSRTHSYSVATDASLGIAAVSAVLSVTFLWMERSDRRAVSVAVAPTGIAVKGAF